MIESINRFFSTMGPTVIVPIVIFLVALVMRVQIKTSIMSALYAGIGLTGFGWIINSFTPSLTKIVKQMVETTGANLPVVDIGWQAGSLASFASPVGVSFFVSSIAIELILFATGVTKVFMASNLWNNFGFMIWGTLCYSVTHNFWLSLGLSYFMLFYSLLLAEIQADRWSDYYKIKGATVCSPHNIEQLIPAVILDPLWNALKLNEVRVTPDSLKKTLGIFGEPTFLGAILGLVIGILGNLNSLLTITSWGQILTFSIELSAVMTIFPLVTKIFSKAFIPIANEIEERKSSKNTSHSNNMKVEDGNERWFLAVDDGVGFGEPATILSGLILIPLIVVISFILPGNKTLPIVDLIAIPFMIQSFVAISKGNILKIIINGLIWFSLGLYMSSWIAPMYTEALVTYGSAIPAGIILITSFNLISRPFNGLVFFAFISKNPIFIGTLLVLYIISLVITRKYRSNIWRYLKTMSEKNGNSTKKN